jgi:aspartate aminotransferase-like enzyme
MIKKVKVASIFVNDEKTITSKKDGKEYKLCDVNVKIADDSNEYAGKYVRIGMFAYNDPKDPKKNKTATEKANYWKTQNNEKEILLDITEEKYTDKDGFEQTALRGKTLSKKAQEVASQFVK